MIALPAGWRRAATATFASPDRSWQLRYLARRTPLARVAAIVDGALAELPEWCTESITVRERLVTHEGEYAFVVSSVGRWLDSAARRYIGVIYGDDCYDLLDALVLGLEPIEPRGRALVQSVALRLGVRRRRYFYDRPADWHGHADGLTTHWFPARFPARPSTIIVYPANPTGEQPQAIFEAMVAHHAIEGDELREVAGAVPIVARDGLAGMHWRLALSGARSVGRDLVVYARGHFTYALQLDAFGNSDDDAREVFLALARSVEPIPDPRAEGAQAAFSHYF